MEPYQTILKRNAQPLAHSQKIELLFWMMFWKSKWRLSQNPDSDLSEMLLLDLKQAVVALNISQHHAISVEI